MLHARTRIKIKTSRYGAHHAICNTSPLGYYPRKHRAVTERATMEEPLLEGVLPPSSPLSPCPSSYSSTSDADALAQVGPLQAPAETQQADAPRSCGKMFLGLLFVFGMITSQQVQTEMLQYQEKHTNLSVPVESIWVNHTWMMWYLPFALLLSRWKHGRWVSPWVWLKDMSARGMSTSLLCRHTICLSLLYLAPNVAWAFSMKQVSATLSVATQQSTPVFVYLLSLCFLGQRLRLLPVLAVASCSAGVAFFILGQAQDGVAGGSNGGGSLGTYLLLLSFPTLISGYQIFFKQVTSKYCLSAEAVLVFMSLIGVANVLTCWPALLISSAVGFEGRAYFPTPWSRDGLFLYGNALLATIYNFCLMMGIYLLGPFYISVGAVTQIPVSAVTDYFLHGNQINWYTIAGGVLIAAGFLTLSIQLKK